MYRFQVSCDTQWGEAGHVCEFLQRWLVAKKLRTSRNKPRDLWYFVINYYITFSIPIIYICIYIYISAHRFVIFCDHVLCVHHGINIFFFGRRCASWATAIAWDPGMCARREAISAKYLDFIWYFKGVVWIVKGIWYGILMDSRDLGLLRGFDMGF